MRTLRRNKQDMFYALYDNSVPVYVLDENGDKIVDYVDEDGTTYYREAGTKEDVFSSPVPFSASISSELNELHARSYGVDQSSIYSEICVHKGKLPLKYGAKIWRENEIVWKDDAHTVPDGDSADYTVMGIMTEYINEDWYLLQRNNN